MLVRPTLSSWWSTSAIIFFTLSTPTSLQLSRSFNTLVFFFFFQAEDGIRDDLVTGVQTCALPIYRHRQVRSHRAQDRGDPRQHRDARLLPPSRRGRARRPRHGGPRGRGPGAVEQIGRASCRERV